MAPTGGFKGKGEHHGMVGEDDQWKLNPKSKFTKNLYICIMALLVMARSTLYTVLLLYFHSV